MKLTGVKESNFIGKIGFLRDVTLWTCVTGASCYCADLKVVMKRAKIY